MSDEYVKHVEILLQARGKDEVKKEFDEVTDSVEGAGKKLRSVWDQVNKVLELFDPTKKSFQLLNEAISPKIDINPFNGVTDALDSVQVKASDAVNAIKKVSDEISGIEKFKTLTLADITDVTGPLKASEAIKALNEINGAISMSSPKGLEDVLKNGLPSLDLQMQIPEFEGGRLEKLAEVSNIKTVQSTIDQLSRAIDYINKKEIHPLLRDDATANLSYYKDTLEKVNQKHIETANFGSSKMFRFLDRYKYSLLLIGGALTAIAGTVRYSATFGTALDVVGQAVGYLADVILFPLLPSVIWLTEQIIGLADWFGNLPDPIKEVITLLMGLGAAFILLAGLGPSKILKDIGEGLLKIGPLGWLSLGLLALAIGAFLTNFGNFRDNFNELISDVLAGWDRLAHGDFDGALKFGIEIVFDLFKIANDLMTSVSGVMKWVSQKAGETFSDYFLRYTSWSLKSNISTIWNLGKLIEDYISGLTLEKVGQDLTHAIFDGMMTAKFPAYQFIKNLVSGEIDMKDLRDLGTSMGQSIVDAAVFSVFGGAGKIFENFVTGAFRGAYKWGAVNIGGMSPEEADKMMGGIADANDKSYNVPYLSELMRPVKQEDTLQRYFDEQKIETLLKEQQQELESRILQLSFPAPELLSLDVKSFDEKSIDEMNALLDRMHDYQITKYTDFQAMMEEIGADPTSKYREAFDLIYPNVGKSVSWKGPGGSAYPDMSEFDPVQSNKKLLNQSTISPDLALPDANTTSKTINTWWRQVMSGIDVSLPAEVNATYNMSDISETTPFKALPELPSTPAPILNGGGSNQPIVNNTYETNNVFNINGYQKDTRQLADEIARIWDAKTRGTRF